MIISTSSHNIRLTSELDKFVGRTLRTQLYQVRRDILSIDVYMQNGYGPTGCIDKLVVIRIHLHDRRQFVIETSGEDLHTAIRHGAKRASQSIWRGLENSDRTLNVRVIEQPGKCSLPSAVRA